MTQNELSLKTNFSRPNLSSLENGKHDITLNNLHKFSQALEIDICTLIDKQPPVLEKLNRLEIDEIAKMIASGQRTSQIKLNQIADDLSSLIINKLKAHDVKISRNLKRKKWEDNQQKIIFEKLYGKKLIKAVLKSVDKYL